MRKQCVPGLSSGGRGLRTRLGTEALEKQKIEIKWKLEMETGNGNWKWKLETEIGNRNGNIKIHQSLVQ